ncbi:sulfhydryl oxidase 1 [Culicoides brevitarsis]|uniref:sulfhydryl oxidase 1 n=1 Tax=Culicoides brevitarsis TaxID=469753 RepID=UPI00307B71A4
MVPSSRTLFQTTIFLIIFTYCHIDANSNKSETRVIERLGLYSDSQYVISLTVHTLKPSIYDKNYASLVEFYNSFCGHCKRFAPIYNQIAANVSLWYPDILQVVALDCSVEENSDTCREFEVMAYPTLRYFPPHYKQGEKTLGNPLEKLDPAKIIDDVVGNITTEKNPPSNWPSFDFLTTTNKEMLFNDVSANVKYIFLFYERNSSLLGSKLILDLHQVKEVQLKRVSIESPFVTEFGLHANAKLVALNRALVPVDLNIKNSTAKDDIVKAIVHFLKSEGVKLPKMLGEHPAYTITTTSANDNVPLEFKKQQEEAIRTRVKENLGTVYLADLEQVLRQILFIEVPRVPLLEGEKLLALQRFLTVIERYFPFNDNGKKFIQDLRSYVMNRERINGSDFDEKVPEIANLYIPIFSSDRWVGCLPSRNGFRQYPCGLWTLFHYLTVRAAEMETSNDALEILQAMHGYIKNFFGCTECAKHFQEMATRNHIWSVASKDDAVLWLWSAHNEVNKRLAGDETEDPEFPKLQFPSNCDACRREQSNVHGHKIIGEIQWDRSEVLKYLKEKNSPANLDLLGVEHETTLPRFMAQHGANRGNIFTDMDIRMGMLLYVSCIAIMVIAVKFFLKRGYRKKLYIYDMLGKV